MKICERLFITMQEKGVMQKDILEQIDGLNKSKISYWKTNKIDPPAEFIVPLAKLLNVSVEYLLTGDTKSAPSVVFPSKQISAKDSELLQMFHAVPLAKQEELISELTHVLAMMQLGKNADVI